MSSSKADPFEILGRLCAKMVDDLNALGYRARDGYDIVYVQTEEGLRLMTPHGPIPIPIKMTGNSLTEKGLELMVNRKPTPDMAGAMQYKFRLAGNDVDVSIEQRHDEHLFLIKFRETV